jgi:YD repeat-containing protein
VNKKKVVLMKMRNSITQFVSRHKHLLQSLMIGIALSTLSIPISAQQGGSAYYQYDANGRLTAVFSPTGEAAVYNYDPAGNFTSITRYAANQLSILDFTPGSGG